MIQGLAEDAIESGLVAGPGEIQLVLTSPPFPLKTQEMCGSLQGQHYIDWLASFAVRLRRLLRPDGSLVLELGNAWEVGEPVMSTLPLRALLAFQEAGEFELCQQFIERNPARLPGPAQWVDLEHIGVEDSFTHLWWLSATAHPKADYRRVLPDNRVSMKPLLLTQKFNSGIHRSDDRLGPPSSTDSYQMFCRNLSLRPHPSRMRQPLADFFIRFLTEPGDLVYDPFAGSNTTGAAAEESDRRWLATEPVAEWVIGSRGRFTDIRNPGAEAKGPAPSA
jgi:site-specific DNA-methyltransferase (cytosine-N4-specific)